MKYCQVCKREYVGDRKVCWCVETSVMDAAAKQDRYIGRLIDGRFEVLSKLGDGAMGSVYLAEQVDTHKRIALKILNPQFAIDTAYVTRFCAAARLATSLRHPNIATVIDFDQTTDGCLFVAMEFVDGEALDRIIDRTGGLPVTQALHLAAQIAGAFAAAHRLGVLHRDLRPGNILIVGDGEMAKITDFAVPRTQRGSSFGRPVHSELAPEYTAPEQVSGSDPTEQTNIYIFGIVLYQMLTGQVPFRASTQLGTLLCQINETPLPLRQLRPEVPAAAENVVMRALAKKPAKRYSTMARMAKELGQVAKSLGPPHVPLTPRGSDVTIARYVPRWKGAITVALGLLASAAYLGISWELSPAPSAPATAISRSEAPSPQRGAGPRSAVVVSRGNGPASGNLNALADGIGKIEEPVRESAAPVVQVKQPFKPAPGELKVRQQRVPPLPAGENKITDTPRRIDLQPATGSFATPLAFPRAQQQPPPLPVVKLDVPELAANP